MNGLNGQSQSGLPIFKTREKVFFRDRSEKDERMPAAEELTDSGKKLHESAAYSQELLVKLRIFVYIVLCIRDAIHIKMWLT